MPIVTTEHAPYGTDPENLKGMKSRHYEGLIDLPRTKRQEWVEGTVWTFPELGTVRCYRTHKHNPLFDEGVVIPIKGRNIRIKMVGRVTGEDSFVPARPILEWEVTEDPETPYEEWEPTEFDRLTGEPLDLGPGFPYSVQFFGQPAFIQGHVYPNVDGNAPYHLFTLWSGWGDGGNENVLVSLDDEGLPLKFWFEASCY